MAKESYQLGSVNMRTTMGGPRMRAAEKPKDFKGAVKKLFAYCGKFKALLIAAMICAAASSVFNLVGPGKLSTITDMISDGIETNQFDIPTIMNISVKLLLVYVASSALIYAQNFMMVTFSQTIARNMRKDISEKLERIPLSRFDSSSFGDLISRVTNDVDTISDSLRMALADIITAAVIFVGATFLMFRTNVILAALAIASSMLGFFAMKVLIKRSQKYFSGNSYCLGQINGHIEETYAGHQIVKSFNGEKQELAKFDEINERLYENAWKSQFMSGIMQPIMQFVGNLGYVLVCVAGGILAAQGTITFGIIVAFIVYVKLFTQPLGQVAQAATSLQSAAAAAERIFSFLGEDEMEDESNKVSDFKPKKGEVIFDHVNFGYVPEKTIIHDFSVKIEPGQQVAIVGPTGAGKTTIVNLLMRFYELNSGRILIDGQDIHEITREDVHDMFGMVLQDTWIFEDTIRANIAYCKPDVTDEEIEKACRAVGLDTYIQSLPDGYNTILKDDSNLSAGQRQLLTIARAMIADQPLLILDEATSSVDTRTEQMVQNAMNKLTKGRTSFTIAHRLSTIRDADVILVMKDGDIIEKGTHNELLAKGGFYADLWQSQFVNAEAI